MSSGTKLSGGDCPEKPELIFTQLAWEKMWHLTRAAKTKVKAYECTSFGIMDPEDPCRVLDIWVPEQSNSGASTKPDEESVLGWTAEMISSGTDMGQLTFWQHSHADMDVFLSGTDLATIERMECDNIQWSVVTNMAGHILVRADIFKPFRYWWNDCSYEVEYPSVDGLTSWVLEQKQKMTFESPTPKKWTGKKKHKSSYAGRYQGLGNAGNHHLPFNYQDTAWHGYGYGYGSFEVQETVAKGGREYLEFTHSGIQEAYDNFKITAKEAENLEHAHCLGAKNEKEINEELEWLTAHGDESDD
tara:strand:+ start:266 stop:1171 length:906 start_codon:yes stop_codon:yes gene_type:complete